MIIKQCLTGKDNQTYDIGRILWVIGVLIFFILAIIDDVKNGKFDPQSYGIGLGGLLAGGGAAIGLKLKGEPEC